MMAGPVLCLNIAAGVWRTRVRMAQIPGVIAKLGEGGEVGICGSHIPHTVYACTVYLTPLSGFSGVLRISRGHPLDAEF